MAQILVRNLDEKVVERLKARARQNRRSLQAEAASILEDATWQLSMAEARELSDQWQRHFAGRQFSDSADLIREDRER